MLSPTSTIAKAEQNPQTTLIALITNVTAMATSLVPLVVKWNDIVHVLGPVVGGIIVALGALAIASTCVAAAGASILKLFPRNDAEHDVGAAPSSDSGQSAAGASMNFFQTLEKDAADFVLKPSVDKFVADLKANRDANIAILEKDLQTEGATAVSVIVNFGVSKLKSTNPVVQAAENVAELGLPTVEAGIASALGNVGSDIPTAYDKFVVYVEKVDSEL